MNERLCWLGKSWRDNEVRGMCKDDEEEKLQWENKGIEKNEKIAVKERAGGEKDLQSKKETKGKKKRLSGDERKVESNGYG